MSQVVLVDAFRFGGASFDFEEKSFNKYGVNFIVANAQTEEALIDQACGADILLTAFAPITARVIDAFAGKAIIRYGIGVDNVDLAAASKKGIWVCNVPDYCVDEVATHTLAMALALSRKLAFYDTLMKKGEWAPMQGYAMHRLSRQTVGLFGFGRIAQKVAQYFQPLGCALIAYDPMVEQNVFERLQVKAVDFEILLQDADILSIHAPLTTQTHHLFNSQTLAKMKDGAFLINTSRGPITVLEDVLLALQKGKLAGAALDVFEKEPPTPAMVEQCKHSNLLTTPHVAYLSVEAMQRLHERVVETALEVLAGRKPQNVVN